MPKILPKPINVGIIMDGNGRWAKSKKISTTSGHEAGIKTIRLIVEESILHSVSSLTLYAFSTENWQRPKTEVIGIGKLLIQAIKEQVPELKEQGVKITFFGNYKKFGTQAIDMIRRAENDTELKRPKLLLNIALGYGGRSDIVNGINKIIFSNNKKKITEQSFFSFLEAPVDELDLLIRTGGDKRISNFLLYHLAYTELLFVDTLWPDFSQEEYSECLNNFTKVERRFGKRI
ncbi:MAG: polyprenyl diphosphate synthase [Gammaproteobacteria bacterium]